MNKQYNDQYVNCNIEISKCYRTLTITGNVYSPEKYTEMEIIAPNPPPYMTSYSGTGLPYSCLNQALEGTKNKLYVKKDGFFKATFSYPNSYYSSDMTVKVKPSIFFNLKNVTNPDFVRIELPDPYQLRSLIYRRGYYSGPIFYDKKEEVVPMGTAYQTMMNIKEAKTKYDIAM
jgi:hypothetical protein